MENTGQGKTVQQRNQAMRPMYKGKIFYYVSPRDGETNQRAGVITRGLHAGKYTLAPHPT